MMTSESIKRVRKFHTVGQGTKIVTLHPDIVKALGIDDLTFAEQEIAENGSAVLLRLRRLS